MKLAAPEGPGRGVHRTAGAKVASKKGVKGRTKYRLDPDITKNG